MSEVYELSVEARIENGKASSRRLRRLKNKIPAIIYGGKKPTHMIQVDHNVLSKALENEGFYSRILTLNVDGKKEKVVLKDLHRHPSKPQILHADFQRVSPNTQITIQVPVHFIGADNSPGIKDQAGVVAHLMNEIEIRCLPDSLPEFIEVDLSHLSVGESVYLSEIKLPKGVDIVAIPQGEGHDQPVASIHKPTVPLETSVTEESPPSPENNT